MSFKSHILVVCCLAAVSVTAASAQTRMTKAEYIEKYKGLALENQETHGVPASITIAQGLLESDCGNSRLAVLGNNHFGIKCKKDWTGETMLHDDDADNECFRKYPSAEASYRDHCDFLDKSPRYASLFELDPLDYKGWAHGLKAAGYATNPRYAEILIKTIEDNELYVLDNPDAGYVEIVQENVREEVISPVEDRTEDRTGKIDLDNYVVEISPIGGYAQYANNGTAFVVAKAGDTYRSLSSSLKIAERRLRKFNDAAPGSEPATGDPVYIKAKCNKALGGKLIHTVSEGETMLSISQAYGIKVQKLLKINRRSQDMPLKAGMQVRLS